MSQRLISCAGGALALLSLVCFPLSLCAERREASNTGAAESVEFFAAMNAGKIAVTVIPRDSKKLTMQIENKTEAPLSVQAPPAFAAVPVAAQFGPGIGDGVGLFDDAGGRGNQGNQAVGGPFNFGGNDLGGNPGGPGGFRGGGVFNVPSGKTIKRRFACVCLEHGKPEPRARIPYQIKPLQEVSSSPAVAELMQLFASGKFSQQIVQLAAWHLANDKSWSELAREQGRRANGQRYLLYSTAQIKQAQRLVELLPAQHKEKTPRTSSLSRR